MLRLDLVVERLGIMVVDENELPARGKLIYELEDLLVCRCMGTRLRTSISFGTVIGSSFDCTD